MISVVIPVYNEAGCLQAHVESLSAILSDLADDAWEIVLVDDGSRDETPGELAVLARSPHVSVQTHAENQGKGAAVRTGVMATRGDMVLFCDADMSTPPETLAEFKAAMDEGADVVVGNRKSKAADIQRWQPPIRTWLGLGFTRLANWMTGLSISDYTCGFKLFRGDVARRVFEATETPGWSFDVEILARVAREGLHVREIPVRWHHVDDTRVRIARDVIRSFLELLSIRRRLGRFRKGAK
ncbi:MAG: glycosyltransferase [Planctomycetota bacterium]|jgi:dolichyl-phosphate beta-glucosyltransferase